METLCDKKSLAVIDAWKATPPCDPSKEHIYCHVQCPYFDECFPEEYEEEEDWDEED